MSAVDVDVDVDRQNRRRPNRANRLSARFPFDPAETRDAVELAFGTFPRRGEEELKTEKTLEEAEQVGKQDATSDPKVVDVDNVRFNGNNYTTWLRDIQSYVLPRNVLYVLSVPCPSVVVGDEASPEEVARLKNAQEKWKSDDSLCYHTILNHLCDHIFQYFSRNKQPTAKLLLHWILMIHGIGDYFWGREYLGTRVLDELEEEREKLIACFRVEEETRVLEELKLEEERKKLASLRVEED